MAIFTGASGDDSILGTANGDDFHLEQGGDDTAQGAGGIDVFYMGAAFTGADQIDGGEGKDILVLNGDYAAGVVLDKTSLVSVEQIRFTAGHSYALSGLTDANLVDFDYADGSTLGAGDSLQIDASGARKLAIQMRGGAGDDVLVGGGGADYLQGGLGDDRLVGGGGYNTLNGGGGHDTLIGGDGHDYIYLGGDTMVIKAGDNKDIVVGVFADSRLRPGDKIDGGAGSDRFLLQSSGGGAVVLRDGTLTGFEQMTVSMGKAFTLVTADGTVAAGETLKFGATSTQSTFTLDASRETDGAYDAHGSNIHANTLIGGAGHDTLDAGIAADSLDGGAGDDVLKGHEGADILVGGLGQDSLNGGDGADGFVFHATAESTAAAPDIINDLAGDDLIDLGAIDADTATDGDQAFHLVAALGGHAGELALTYDDIRDVTNIEGDIDGDGVADLVIQAAGQHADFTHFVL